MRYQVCRVIPYGFVALLILSAVAALVAHADNIVDSTLAATLTFVGVIVAFLIEAFRSRMQQRRNHLERSLTWIGIAQSGATANLRYISQMIRVELPNGQVPTYRSDQTLRSLQRSEALGDLVKFPDLTESLRSVLFELDHLDRKLDLAFLLIAQTPNPNQQQQLQHSLSASESIARNSLREIVKLLRECKACIIRIEQHMDQ